MRVPLTACQVLAGDAPKTHTGRFSGFSEFHADIRPDVWGRRQAGPEDPPSGWTTTRDCAYPIAFVIVHVLD
jgi:hypothetical protein